MATLKQTADEEQPIIYLTDSETADLRTVVDASRVSCPLTRTVTGEGDIADVRTVAAQAMEVGADEQYGLDTIPEIYRTTTEALFPLK